jgi:hypothetical protein
VVLSSISSTTKEFLKMSRNVGNEKINKSNKKTQWKVSPMDYTKQNKEYQRLKTKSKKHYIQIATKKKKTSMTTTFKISGS